MRTKGFRRLYAGLAFMTAGFIVAAATPARAVESDQTARPERPVSAIGWVLGQVDAALTEARAGVLAVSGQALQTVTHGAMEMVGLGLTHPIDPAVAAEGFKVIRAATGVETLGAAGDRASDPSLQETRHRHGSVLAGSGSDAVHKETLGYLIERAGYEVDTVVEGLNPLPVYCVAFEQTEYKSKEERQQALNEINSYFALRRQQQPWYDFWTSIEQWAITEIAQADTDLSRLAAMMDLRLEGVDLHMLPLPSAEIDFHSGEDVAMADYEPPSEVARLIREYGYYIVFIEEGIGIEGPETKILMRKTKLLSAEESRAVRAEIEDWLSNHPDGWSFNYFWDRMFFQLLIGVEEDAIRLGELQDLMLHDIIIKLSILPDVTTRLRHTGKPIEHYPPPPCA